MAAIKQADNNFYRNSYNSIIITLIAEIIILLVMVNVVMYQILHRHLPTFSAMAPDGKQLALMASIEPNLLSTTLVTWAEKAAVAAYTFDFVNYNKQIMLARPYFTDAGWNDYQNSIAGLISTITKNQLFVNGVVSGPPVIANQGVLPGRGYTWRIQIPFLVTYQSAEETSRATYTVVVTIVKVPTSINPQGIGIDQFIMA
jgi:intracellular multiplication protein IcmL